jgi:hypothetical protein
MMFNNKFNRTVVETGEVNSGEIITEKYGFINTEKQIKMMMRSGELLQQARSEMFDIIGEEIDESFKMDPTRESNFDLADASSIYQRFLDQVDANEQRAIAEAEKEAELKKKEVEEEVLD